MGFSKWEYWSGLPCPAPEDLPNPGIEPTSLRSLALAGGFFTTIATWEVPIILSKTSNKIVWVWGTKRSPYLSFTVNSQRPPCGNPQFSFLCSREAVRDIVLEKFAGPCDKGEYSPSVQKTLYDIQVLSLSQLPEVRFVTCHSED